MRKRRVTLSLDEDVVEALEAIDGPSLSAVANDALREVAAAAAHRRAMLAWLDELDAELGAPTPQQVAEAEALLEELGVVGPGDLSGAA
jgi:hypothetical protein